MLLDDVVVSIEPVCKCGNRKRDRDDDGGRDRPAFFSCRQNIDTVSKPPDVANTAKDENAVDKNQSKVIDIGKINNDPAICSFEVAVVKRKHVLYGLGHTKDMLTTPNKKDSVEVDEDEATGLYNHDSKILLFRFGNYFVFEANASSVVNVDFIEKDAKRNGAAPKENDDEHKSKRRRTEAGKVDSLNDEKRPAYFYIEFPSCVFRAFSVDSGTTDVGALLLKASRILTEHCDMESSSKTWDIHRNVEDFTESWSVCLDLEQMKDNVSSTKTDSASTHIEQGQQQSANIKPSKDNDMDDEAGDEVNNSETQPMDSIAKKSSEHSSQKSNNQLQNSSKADSICSNQKDGGQDCSFLDEISSKRRDFDNSWSHLNESMSSNGKSTPLTSCAHLLASSYCDPKQLVSYNDQCDAEIEHDTGEIQDLIETVMPVRGRVHDSRVSTPARGSSVDIEQNIHDLLLARKKAVAAKYALLFMPKR
jgi:hypothetical protein